MRLIGRLQNSRLQRHEKKILRRVLTQYAYLRFFSLSLNSLFLSLSGGIIAWKKDESGLVLVFSALVLPIILLIGVLVLQSGQLYVRQAQLQFVARQAANSSLIPVAELLKLAAESNYQNTCNVEFPPGVCSSHDWTDFLTLTQAQNLTRQTSTVALVGSEVQSFATNTDPKALLRPEYLVVEFPFNVSDSSQAVARVRIIEPQTNWIGNILKSENYAIEVEARSYLNLQSS